MVLGQAHCARRIHSSSFYPAVCVCSLVTRDARDAKENIMWA